MRVDLPWTEAEHFTELATCVAIYRYEVELLVKTGLLFRLASGMDWFAAGYLASWMDAIKILPQC
ncbi:MAG: hypothetical protein JWQ21_3103 [Herminiimonas sp.]|nr:hypothetical protein [Herminiimonas sp.]